MANLNVLNQVNLDDGSGPTFATFNPKDIACITCCPIKSRAGEPERSRVTIALHNGQCMSFDSPNVGNEKSESAIAAYNRIVEGWQEALINMAELENAPPKLTPSTAPETESHFNKEVKDD